MGHDAFIRHMHLRHVVVILVYYLTFLVSLFDVGMLSGKKFFVIVDDLFVCNVLVFTDALPCCAQPWRHTSHDLTGLTHLCVSGLISMGHGPFTRDMT